MADAALNLQRGSASCPSMRESFTEPAGCVAGTGGCLPAECVIRVIVRIRAGAHGTEMTSPVRQLTGESSGAVQKSERQAQHPADVAWPLQSNNRSKCVPSRCGNTKKTLWKVTWIRLKCRREMSLLFDGNGFLVERAGLRTCEFDFGQTKRVIRALPQERRC